MFMAHLSGQCCMQETHAQHWNHQDAGQLEGVGHALYRQWHGLALSWSASDTDTKNDSRKG